MAEPVPVHQDKDCDAAAKHSGSNRESRALYTPITPHKPECRKCEQGERYVRKNILEAESGTLTTFGHCYIDLSMNTLSFNTANRA